MLILGLLDVPWWGLLVVAVIGYLLYTLRDFNYFRKQGIPGQIPVPILGTSIYMRNESLACADLKKVKEYRNRGIWGEFLGSVPALVVSDAKMLSEIMVKEFPSFVNRVNLTRTGTISDSMLVNLEGDHWKYVRNEMTPTFTTGKLKKMNSEINRCAKTLTDNLLEQAKSQKRVEMKEYSGGYAMDVIASTAFGIRVDSQKDRNNAFVTHARTAFDDFTPLNPKVFLMIFFPELTSLLKRLGVTIDIISKDILDFFSSVTRQAIEMRKSVNDQSRTDFIQLMINAQKGQNINEDENEGGMRSPTTGLTDDEILANAIVFFVGGYDTTATSLGYLFYNLAINPGCQERLVEEINRVVGDKDLVDYSFLQDMPYLEKCVNENLRMYPPAVRVNRKAARDITINGIFIRKGIIVEIPIYAIHHDPEKWPDPEKFDPERFTMENKKNRDQYDFIPFGNGPRNCVGMRLALQELKMAAIHVLRKIKVSPCERTQVPIKFLESGFILHAKDGLWVKVEPRSRN